MKIEITLRQTHGWKDQIRVTQGETQAYYFLDGFGLEFSLALKGGMEHNVDPFPHLGHDPDIKKMIGAKRRELVFAWGKEGKEGREMEKCPFCGGPAECKACGITCAGAGGLTEEGLCAGCSSLKEGREMKLETCGWCKWFKSHPSGTKVIQGGWWMGDGRCTRQKPPHNITVQGSTCENYKETTEGE